MLNVSVESATLNLTVAGVGSTPSGGGISVGDYFRLYGSSKYEEAKSYTQGGSGYSNYTLTILSGASFDPMSLNQNNYNSWIGSLNTTSANGNVVPEAVTKIHMDAAVNSTHRFDVTNAISKWSRSNDGSAQIIRIANDAWDNYIASLSHVSGGPSIELTLKEMPNFAVNDYDINNTTVKLRSFTANDQKGSVYTKAIAIDGLTSYEATVEYEIFDVDTKEVIVSGETEKARETYTYPYYNHSIDKAQNYYRLESNYQVKELINADKFKPNKLYQVRVRATEEDVTTDWISGDSFQIYNVGYKFETFYRILNFYGRSSDSLITESKIDNNMINPLISEKNSLFIRNPKKNKGKVYVASNLDDSSKWLIDQGLMGMNLKCEYGFEPINFNNGNFFYTSSDATIFNGENKFEIERYYNSKKGGVETSFGRNWSSVFDAKIQVLENGSIAFSDPSGRVHVMSKNSDESYNPSYGENYTFEMVKVGDYVESVDSDYYIPALSYPAVTSEVKVDKYNYIVTTSDETKYYFDDLLQLIKIEYKNSQSVMFEHNNYGVSKVISDSGKVISFTYNTSGYISKMTLPDLSEVGYYYDEVGNLVKYVDQNGVGIDYIYDDNYLMIGYKLSNSSQLLITNEYDESGRVREQVDINGNISRLSYNQGYTKIIDGRGNSKVIYFNEYLYTTKIIDNGLVTEYSYDELGNVTGEKKYSEGNEEEVEIETYEYDGNDLISSTSPLNIKTEYSYDENSNIIKIDNGSYETIFEYDSSNNLVRSYSEVEGEYLASYNESGYKISETNANNGTTTYEYDGKMHVVSKISPTGTKNYSYDDNGLLILKQNEFGGVYEYKRNSRGEIVKTIDPYGNEEKFEFDDMGNLVAKQDLNGNIVNYKYDEIGNLIEEINAYGSTKYYYDEVYNLIEVVDGEKNSTKYEYDSKNNISKEISANGNEKDFVYDNHGNVIEVSDSIGLVNKYEYDSNQKLVSSTDANGVVTEYEYDIRGQLLVKKVSGIVVARNEYNKYMQLATSYDGNEIATTYGYESNQLVYESRSNINTKTYEYNSIAQVSLIKDSYESATTITYGSEGSVVKTTDADGVVTTFKHDLAGRVVEISVGGVVTSKKSYYPTGIVKEEEDGNGNKKTYIIDNASRLAGVIDNDGNTHSYKYDSVGNIIEETDAYENVTSYEYDEMGNVVVEENSLNEKTYYEYDLRGNLVKRIDPDVNYEEYKYDGNSNIIEVVKRNGVVISYYYDDFNRLVKEKDSTGQKNIYTYDNNGNMLSEENQGNQKNIHSYDELNNLIKTQSFDGNITRYIYDMESRLVEEIDPLGNSKYTTYSAGGRVSREVAINKGVTNFVYNNRGLVSEISNPLEEVIKYEYDNNGNVVKELDSYNNSVVYEYNYNNQVVSKTNQVGITQEYVYDALGNLVKEVDGNANATSYKYDGINRVVESVDALGFKTRYEYDLMGNVISYVDGNDVEIKYVYDVVGNLLAEKYENNSTLNYTYDLRDNKTSEEDGNGNKTFYAYDNLNRVVKEVAPSGNAISYEYDEKGDLVEESDNISTINKYTYNKVHNVVRKEDALGAVENYTYCKCGGIIETITDDNGNTTTYEYDLLNRVKSSNDERGVVTEFEYDIYGNTKSMIINNSRVYNYEYDGASRLVKEVNPLNEETAYEYDSANNLVKTTSASGSETSYVYDKLNRVVEEEDALGYSKKYRYDAVNLVEEIDQEENSTKYEYDSVGNIIKVEDASKEIVSYSYDKNSNLKNVSIRGRVVQKYNYDSSNNVISEKNVEGKEKRYEYDIRNNVSKEIKNDGQEIIMKYNNLNSMISSLSSDNEIENRYDTNNNLLTSVQNEEVTQIKYNKYNDIEEYVDENNNTVKYTYDEYGNKTSVEYSDGSKIEYEYDELNRLVKIIDVEKKETIIKYDESGNRIAEIFPGNVEVRSEYDGNNNLVSKEYRKEGKVVLTLSYVYTPRGQVSREERREYSDDESEGALQTIKSYEYDEIGQLTKAEYEITKAGVVENISYEYSYNAYNNRDEVRVEIDGEVEVISEKVNESGQVVVREGKDFKTKYEYDENGNLIKELSEDGSSLVYEYNTLNQLVSVVSSDGYYETYDYDGLGNRVEKASYTPYGVYNTNGYSSNLTLKQELENFVEEETSHKDKENETKTLKEALEEDKDCGESEGEELDKQVIEYVNDINTEYEKVLEVKGEEYTRNIYGEDYALMTNGEVNMLDHKGSVVGSIGRSITTNDYTPQGSTLNTKLVKSVEKKDVIGYNNEIEDNFDLQYLRARYYKQEEARFISEDTYKGSIGEKNSHNRYTYVENDGVNNIDPSGHKPPSKYKGPRTSNSRSISSSKSRSKKSGAAIRLPAPSTPSKSKAVYGPPAPAYVSVKNEIYNQSGINTTRPAGMSDDEYYNYLVEVKKFCDDLKSIGINKGGVGVFVENLNTDIRSNNKAKKRNPFEIFMTKVEESLTFDSKLQKAIIAGHEKYRKENPETVKNYNAQKDIVTYSQEFVGLDGEELRTVFALIVAGARPTLISSGCLTTYDKVDLGETSKCQIEKYPSDIEKWLQDGGAAANYLNEMYKDGVLKRTIETIVGIAGFAVGLAVGGPLGAIVATALGIGGATAYQFLDSKEGMDWEEYITDIATEIALAVGGELIGDALGAWLKNGDDVLKSGDKFKYTGDMEPSLLNKLNDITLGNGSTGRFVPNDVSEQMFLREVLDNPLDGARNTGLTLSDSRWPAEDGWVKMEVVAENTKYDPFQGTGGTGYGNYVDSNTTIHYVYNTITGQFDDFKFVTN
ncbi:MAG: RHS repeat-associated core domain-containing protein [Bacilli bacterium]